MQSLHMCCMHVWLATMSAHCNSSVYLQVAQSQHAPNDRHARGAYPATQCMFLPSPSIIAMRPLRVLHHSQWSPLCMVLHQQHSPDVTMQPLVTRRPHVAWQAQARLQAAIVSLHFLHMPTPSASALHFQPALQCMALAAARCTFHIATYV
jgi:hypothetical protein